MKVNSIQISNSLKINSNYKNQNNISTPNLLNYGSVDTVSFCRKHATKTEVKNLEHQAKVAIRKGKKLVQKEQELTKQGAELFSKAIVEYKKALDYLKLASQDGSSVELPNGNLLSFSPVSGEDTSSFNIFEYDKDGKLIREARFKDFGPHEIELINDKRVIFNFYSDSIIAIDVYDDKDSLDTIQARYIYNRNGELKNIKTNVRENELETTADEEFEYMFMDLTTCNVGYVKHHDIIRGCNDQIIEKTYAQQFDFIGNKLSGVTTNVDDYGMFGMTWDEGLYLKNDKVVKYEKDAQQVSPNDEPIYINDTPRVIAQRIRLHDKGGHYIKETDVLYDDFWQMDYRAN